MNATSDAGACTRMTSASPRSAIAIAAPVPTAIVLTLYPVRASNMGTRTSSRPESWVLVVVDKISWGLAGLVGDGAAVAGVVSSRAQLTTAVTIPMSKATINRTLANLPEQVDFTDIFLL